MKLRRWLPLIFLVGGVLVLVPPKFITEYLTERRRLNEFERLLPYARSVSERMVYSRELPPESQPALPFTLYATDGRAFGFEVSSGVSIDRNPLYIFVEPSVENPDELIDHLCKDRRWGNWRKLSRPGWYLAWGM